MDALGASQNDFATLLLSNGNGLPSVSVYVCVFLCVKPIPIKASNTVR